MILLLFLLYVISLVTTHQLSQRGAIVEDGKQVDSKVRFLEGCALGKIEIFPGSLAWL